jgi:hypothetical protein
MERDGGKSWVGFGACKLCVDAKRSMHVMKLVMSARSLCAFLRVLQSTENPSRATSPMDIAP